MEPLVSIITVNFRQAAITCLLLDSIKRSSYTNLEVIVIENAPLFDSTARYQKHFSKVNVITSQKNLGFAGGNNLGIKASKGTYLFIVNNDTCFTDGLIEKILKPFQADDSIGAVAPKILYENAPKIIQFAGFTEINPISGRNRMIGLGEEDKGQYDQLKEIPYMHGAAMMVKRSVVEQIGLIPTAYFLYYEELDWCIQIRKAGFKLIFEPQALIYHKGSASIKEDSPQHVYYLNRSRILFMRRQYKWVNYIAFLFFFFLISFPKQSFFFVMKGQFKHLSALSNAIGWHFRNIKG